MATDLAEIVRKLTSLYDFSGKTVIAVGAGGGQLAEYAARAGRVIAIDEEAEALERLRKRARDLALADVFTLAHGDFMTMHPSGDCVLLEFCLHEMMDPGRALVHAGRLAPDVLVIDHAPGSPWEWYAGEEGGVEAGWAAVARGTVRSILNVHAFQRFDDYGALEARLAAQGPTSRERIASFRGQRAIAIPMPYRLALL